MDSSFSNSQCLKATEGNDGGAGGSGGPDGGGTDEFDINLIPEEHRDAFKKFKSGLVEKGIGIATARHKEAQEKNKGKEVEEFLKEQGLSKESIATAKDLLGKKPSLDKLFEVYGTDDPAAIVQMIEEAEQEGLSDLEKAQTELKKAVERENALKLQMDAIKRGQGETAEQAKKREEKLYKVIKNNLVEKSMREMATSLNAIDPDDVLSRLSDFVTVEEEEEGFSVFVLNDKKEKRFDADGKPIPLKTLVSEFLEKRPHLVKSDLHNGAGGAGSAGGGGNPASAKPKFTVAQLKDPKFFMEHQAEILAEVKAGNLKL